MSSTTSPPRGTVACNILDSNLTNSYVDQQKINMITESHKQGLQPKQIFSILCAFYSAQGEVCQISMIYVVTCIPSNYLKIGSKRRKIKQEQGHQQQQHDYKQGLSQGQEKNAKRELSSFILIPHFYVRIEHVLYKTFEY